jgi:hypothetical protein
VNEPVAKPPIRQIPAYGIHSLRTGRGYGQAA